MLVGQGTGATALVKLVATGGAISTATTGGGTLEISTTTIGGATAAVPADLGGEVTWHPIWARTSSAGNRNFRKYGTGIFCAR